MNTKRPDRSNEIKNMFDCECPTTWSASPLLPIIRCDNLYSWSKRFKPELYDLGFLSTSNETSKLRSSPNISCSRYQTKCVSNGWFLCQMRGGCPIIWRSGGADDWSCQFNNGKFQPSMTFVYKVLRMNPSLSIPLRLLYQVTLPHRTSFDWDDWLWSCRNDHMFVTT